jgi:ribosome maturation factor RimP
LKEFHALPKRLAISIREGYQIVHHRHRERSRDHLMEWVSETGPLFLLHEAAKERFLQSGADNVLLNEPRLIIEQGLAARVARIIEGAMTGLGYRLIRVKVLSGNGTTVQIMAERPDGSITVDDCSIISRNISPILDVEDPIEREYNLEVSSPGIDRPLVRISDFTRWQGHEMKLEMAIGQGGRKRFRGLIDSVIDDHLKLAFIDPEPGEPEFAVLPIADMAEAKLMLTDELIRDSFRRAKRAMAGEEASEPSDDDLTDHEVRMIRKAEEADSAAERAARAWQPRPKPKPVKGPGRFAKKK